MKNQKLFDKTIGILVNAYLNDELKHGDCVACAVGNLICYNMYNNDIVKWNRDFVDNSKKGNSWSSVFMTDEEGQSMKPYLMKGEALKQIKSTGYQLNDLAKIENSFETADTGENEDEFMFNGLMAVCDTLMQIHEATAEEITQAKRLFVKEPA